MSLAQDLIQTIEESWPEIAALRHELHQHPEIRFEEVWSSDRIAAFLDDAGIPHKRNLAKGTGIVATIEGKAASGKTVALRADIDALEMTEETGLPYASQTPGRMHACGHDGHIAVLCGAAKALMTHREDLPGNVRLLFQPGEEQGGGARYMVADGALESVDAIFGLHGWPSLRVGQIGVKPGPLMASADFFRIAVRGKGCHGADPAAGVDPVVIAAHITTALQTIVSREVDPQDPAIVTVAHIDAGTTTNIIPDTALMEGTLRSFDPATDATLREALVRIARHTAEALRGSALVEFGGDGYPPLINDEAMTALLAEAAGEALGHENVVNLRRPIMVSEDFACYLEKIPGCFFYLGVDPAAGGSCPGLHTPHYDFGDAALVPGMKVMAAAALRFLAG